MNKKNCGYVQIAIDGTMASGKGTISKALSEKLGYEYLDTGTIYRKLALFSLSLDEPANIVNYLNDININDISGNMRSYEAGQAASKIAILPEVRNFVTSYSQSFAKDKNIIMDGRDIASVIMPNANFKFFITADLEERARRRFLELSEKGEKETFEEILKGIQERDERDMNRDIAPLRQEKDSIVVDNTHMNKEETLNYILSVLTQKI
ncbi:MAG: (d)CMP kinase [Defluviitaleaceae bacterium]|nr:(d)CMP kinase [Defluviitaleaceae bacterium]